MKRYEQIIDLEKLWDNCQYWTLNRAFAQGNPNRSREDLNDTYGLTTDDKKFFFDDYVEFVASEFVASGLFRILRQHNDTAWNGQDLSTDNNALHLFFVAGDKFPCKLFNVILYKYFQFRILWWWYKLKNLDAELQKIDYFLGIEADKIASIVADYTTDSNGSTGWLAYNDGFVDNYPQSSVDFSTLDSVSTGEVQTPTPPTVRPLEYNHITLQDVPAHITLNTATLSISLTARVIEEVIVESLASFKVELFCNGVKQIAEISNNGNPLSLASFPHTWTATTLCTQDGGVYSFKVTMTHQDGTLSVYTSTECSVIRRSPHIFVNAFNVVFE